MFSHELISSVNSYIRFLDDTRDAKPIVRLILVGLLLVLIESSVEAQASNTEDSEGKKQQDDQDHEGFFSRFSLGLGYGTYVGDGRADPIPGVRVIEDPSHGSLALNLALDWGTGIIDNLAIHIGFAFETLLDSDEDSSIDGFYLFGIGGGASYYFVPVDIYLSGHIRWVGALLYIPDAPCSVLSLEKLEGFSGIGLSLSIGKEWFDDEKSLGFGIGLQGNYVHLGGKPDIDYFSVMLVPTLTNF